jgi:hypothetical protein
MKTNEKVKRLIAFGLTKKFLCTELDCSRYLLEKMIKEDNFRRHQEKRVEQLYTGIIA